jgi:hypothetical protein
MLAQARQALIMECRDGAERRIALGERAPAGARLVDLERCRRCQD